MLPELAPQEEMAMSKEQMPIERPDRIKAQIALLRASAMRMMEFLQDMTPLIKQDDQCSLRAVESNPQLGHIPAPVRAALGNTGNLIPSIDQPCNLVELPHAIGHFLKSNLQEYLDVLEQRPNFHIINAISGVCSRMVAPYHADNIDHIGDGVTTRNLNALFEAS
jgi:hypothetical protein